VNLGSSVNTRRDEVSPFIHVNGQTLYFASKGYPGFGGYDLFYAEDTDGKWSTPKNLGWPVNTPEDQISLFVTSNGERAYYSLDSYEQDGMPLSMIYYFDIPPEISVRNRSYYVKGTILDDKTRIPLKARVELRDLNKNELVSVVSSDSIFGEYIMILTEGSEYALYVEKPGYIFESRNFNLPKGSEYEPIIMDFFLKKSETGAITTLNNIFFETDSYELLDRSITELDKAVEYLIKYPTLKIEISGHTDDVGTADYNQQLSLKRAESVYYYMTEQGIADQRLSFQGYGLTQPAFPNDSDENRSKNRRIEFKIVQ
jgi:outer membrane protein OmpA-like peptidoglycan-associated protein